MWKLFQMLRIRFWGLFIVALMTPLASASIGGYADLDTLKNEQQFISSQSRLQQLQPHGQPLLKINSEVDTSSKKGYTANVKDKQGQFSETNIEKSSENKPNQQNNSQQSMKLNQLEPKSKRSNSMEITKKASQGLTNKKTGNNLRISQTEDLQQQSQSQNISQKNSLLNSSNIKKERPKTFKANVKVVSKLPSILNITHRKNKVDWINQHETKNENNSQTIDKIETQNNDKVHIIKYNVVKEIEEISSHLSKPIQHISSTKFMYEFSFEYPMLSQDQNSKIFNQSIDQFSSPIQLSLGSAFQNRLKSQFVVLSKQIPSIQRHLKLKPGSYKIEFEWQSNEPNGELIVFWNHRIVGSYKSVDTLKKQESLHVESRQECFGGDNILKFKIVGPIQIGIDNIQVIN